MFSWQRFAILAMFINGATPFTLITTLHVDQPLAKPLVLLKTCVGGKEMVFAKRDFEEKLLSRDRVVMFLLNAGI